MTSSWVYTRKYRVEKSCCVSTAASASREAATIAVGCPAWTSSAKLGPDNATNRQCGTTCSATPSMNSNEASSMPLVAHTSLVPTGSRGPTVPSTARIAWLGTAVQTTPASRTSLGEVGAGNERRVERRTGKIDVVFVPLVDRVGHVRLQRPEAHRVSRADQQVGKGGAPAAGTEHRDGGHVATPAPWPKRCSVPSRSRRMLARCIQTIRTASATNHGSQRSTSRLENPDRRRQGRGGDNAAKRDVTRQAQHGAPDRQHDDERTAARVRAPPRHRWRPPCRRGSR